MQIDIKEFTQGQRDGDVVWVCDYRVPDIHKKAIRNVRPTKVMVVSKEEVRGTVYYSNSVFMPMNSKGDPIKSKVIKMYDNTGYRSFTGIPVLVFDNEEECVAAFNEQCDTVIADIKTYLANVEDSFKLQIENIKAMKNGEG